MSRFKPTSEQEKVLSFDKKNMIVSASAGSGKTATLVEYISRLVANGQPIKRILLLTFTRAASFEMKERILKNFYEESNNQNILNAIDDIPTADISTIHAFLESIIKKNTNSLNINEGFAVLAEDEVASLKKIAFEEAEKTFKLKSASDYEELYLRMHNNRDFIFKLLNDMSFFFATQNSAEEKIEFYKSSQKKFFIEAIETINNMILPQLDKISKNIEMLKLQLDDEKYSIYIENLQKVIKSGQQPFDKYKNIVRVEIKAPGASKKVDQLALEELKDEYKKFKKIKDTLASLNIDDDRMYDIENFGKIENIIYDFYVAYEKQYSLLKEKLNAVDFNDLERFAKELLKNEEIKNQIQNDYDYIFVDEYQDTNYVQENIVKEIAKKSHFIAVGDPKQGIYGFRNATSEIIKKDIKDYENDSNSSAEFLRKNFRSDAKILNFVNNVFKNVMREESVGIDYLSTSMLEAGGEELPFDKKLPSVRVDLISKEKTEEETVFDDVYDILKESKYKVSSKNLEAKVIATRIQELMLRKIYDASLGEMRNITYKDIVILTRGKSDLTNEIIKELTSQKIPVVSEIRGDFKDYAEIHVLINFFKILLDFRDDNALLSVMLSKIGGFNVDEIASLRINGEEKEFYNVIKNSGNQKVKEFLNMLSLAKRKLEIKGAYIMLEDLLNDVDFRPYILSKENAQNYLFVLNKFMEQLKNTEFQFDLPRLVRFLSQEKIDFKGGGSSGNAVSICTIHASKGLEYPVVILADTGKNMLQMNSANYVFSSEYGLALNFFSRDDDNVYITPLVYLSKLKAREREKNDEIMLLYVALTRAQKHLYISGTVSSKLTKELCKDPFDAKSYIEMILSSYKKLIAPNTEEELNSERVECNVITEIQDLAEVKEKFVGHSDKKACEELNKYFSYKYPHEISTKTIYKNSVSAINESGEAKVFNFKGEDEFVERGNAYHLALKLINFDEISSLCDVENKLKDLNNEDINKYVNSEILYKNILILKDALKNTNKIYKEQQFTSMLNLSEVFSDGIDEEIMLQGVVDLFALGEENVLIDYKFTNDNDEKSIKNRYEKQLILYKNSIEKAFDIKINKVQLLSLKNNKLINF